MKSLVSLVKARQTISTNMDGTMLKSLFCFFIFFSSKFALSGKQNLPYPQFQLLQRHQVLVLRLVQIILSQTTPNLKERNSPDIIQWYFHSGCFCWLTPIYSTTFCPSDDVVSISFHLKYQTKLELY